MRQLEEKIIEMNKTMNMVCIDLEKAFDTVNRMLLWLVVERYGVKRRLKEAVKSLYLRSEACVWIQGQNSDWFGVERGCETGVHLVALAF